MQNMRACVLWWYATAALCAFGLCTCCFVCTLGAVCVCLLLRGTANVFSVHYLLCGGTQGWRSVPPTSLQPRPRAGLPPRPPAGTPGLPGQRRAAAHPPTPGEWEQVRAQPGACSHLKLKYVNCAALIWIPKITRILDFFKNIWMIFNHAKLTAKMLMLFGC